jgi:hypothetical protein
MDEQMPSSKEETSSETVEEGQDHVKESGTEEIPNTVLHYTMETKVWDVIDDSDFEGYGRLIFPADYEQAVERADEERDNQEYPEINTDISDLSQYDTVYLGYQTWSMTLSNPMLSFI